MSSSYDIQLYTKPNCPYCIIMKNLLNQTGFKYTVVDILEDPASRQFIKQAGHQTVPQLYVNGIHANNKNTNYYSVNDLFVIISDIISNQTQSEWPWSDSGIEQGV